MYDDTATVLGTLLGLIIWFTVIVCKLAFWALVFYALLKVAGIIG